MTHRLPVNDFRLDLTLASGQVFRWEHVDPWYYGVIGGVLVRIQQQDNELVWDASDPSLTATRLATYFSLDHDLDAIYAAIDHDEHMHAAIVAYRGLRLIRQHPWECLASYVLTSFNNIQRITRMIENIAHHFGEPIALGQQRTYTFPPAAVLADIPVGRLGLLGLGFRAAYLTAIAQRVAAGKVRFDELRAADAATVKARLRELPGIGDKVADCIALFAFEQYGAFPIDVWTRRALGLYLPTSQLTLAKMHAFSAAHFGAYAGYAQQYLYHWMRTRSTFAQRSIATASTRLPARLLVHELIDKT